MGDEGTVLKLQCLSKRPCHNGAPKDASSPRKNLPPGRIILQDNKGQLVEIIAWRGDFHKFAGTEQATTTVVESFFAEWMPTATYLVVGTRTQRADAE